LLGNAAGQLWAPASTTHAVASNCAAGLGAQAIAAAQPPGTVGVGTPQTRACCVHAHAVVDAAPPEGEQLPPEGAGALIVMEGVAHVEVYKVMSTHAPTGNGADVAPASGQVIVQLESPKKLTVAAPQTTPLAEEQAHAEHESGGCVGVALPS
jgi:hypothetical protein